MICTSSPPRSPARAERPPRPAREARLPFADADAFRWRRLTRPTTAAPATNPPAATAAACTAGITAPAPRRGERSGVPSTLPSVSASAEPGRSPIDSADESFAPAVSDPSGAEHRPAATAGEGEEVDALPVLAGQPAFVRPYPFAAAFSRDWRAAGAVIPAVQAAAVAAGGFVAGAAVVGLVNRRHRSASAPAKGRRVSRAGRSARAGERGGELVQIIGSRSLLVDVHLLGGRD